MLPKGESYNRRFVRPVPCPANNFKLLVAFKGRGKAVHKKNNPTQYIELSPLNHVFIMIACSAHTLLSKKGIEMKLCL